MKTPPPAVLPLKEIEKQGKDMGKVGKVCGLKGKVVQHFF